MKDLIKCFRVVALLTVLLIPSYLVADEVDDAETAVKNKDYVSALKFIREAIKKEPQDLDRIKLGAQIYLEMNIADTAIMYARRIYKDDADEMSNVRLYASALLESKDSMNIIEACNVIRKFRKNSSDIEMAIAHVEALVAADSISAAELVARKLQRDYPKSPEGFTALGDIYLNEKPPVLEQASENYRSALAIDNTLVSAHFSLAICYYRQFTREDDKELKKTYLEKCLDEWSNVTELDPKNARAWYEQGKILFYTKKYAKAVEALTQYRVLRPIGTGEKMTSWFLGESYTKLGKCEEAQPHLEDAARTADTLRPKAAIALARCYFDAKKWESCTKYFGEAAPFPANWEPVDYWRNGFALLFSGDTTRAIPVLLTAADKDPKQCGFMYKLGLNLQGRNDLKNSTWVFQRRLANCKDSNDVRIHILIGNNFFTDSLVDSAIAYYGKALELAPTSLWAMQMSGNAYLASRDTVKSRDFMNRVFTTTQANPTKESLSYIVGAMTTLNSLDIEKRQYQPIVDRSKIVTGLYPQAAAAWLYLGVGYQGLKDFGNAKHAYNEVLKLDPNNKMAKKNLQAVSK